jgi:glycosyltransferase involved in cell wall biosynthesis
MKLSIVVPAYNEEGNIDAIYNNIKNIFGDINYEIIFVNDGSTDKTYKVLEAVYKKDEDHVRVINFSRNFGKDAAIYAGLEHSNGEYTAIIDADMEQNPKYLLEMLTFLDKNKNYDQVAMTIKKRKSGSPIKRLCAKLFYKFINNLSDIKFAEDASDFRMFRVCVKDAILRLGEKNRFSKGIFSWIGFNTKYMEYEVGERKSGETKFNFKNSVKYAVNGIVSFSIKPLKIATLLGSITSFGGFIYLIYIIIKTLILGADTPGFATIVSLILLIGGVQLICIGILGEYISRTFIETKNRPIYITKSELGFDEEIL